MLDPRSGDMTIGEEDWDLDSEEFSIFCKGTLKVEILNAMNVPDCDAAGFYAYITNPFGTDNFSDVFIESVVHPRADFSMSEDWVR